MKDEARPLVEVSPLCGLQCFNAVSWVIGGSIHKQVEEETDANPR